MARFDRCAVCDYSEAIGSSLAGISPGVNGKVRRFGDDQLCDVCSLSVDQARADFRPPDETEEGVDDEIA